MRRLDGLSASALVLLAAYIGQALVGVDYGPLSALQGDERFRLASGAVVGALVGVQWLHPILQRALSRKRRRLLTQTHRAVGCLMIVAFFVHTAQPGTGYLALLAWVFIASAATGPLYAFASAGGRARAVWVGLHILLSLQVLGLLAFHIWAVFAYSPGDGIRLAI